MLRKPDPGKQAAHGRLPSSGGRLLCEIEARGRGLPLPGRPSVPPEARHRSASAWKSRSAKPPWKSRASKMDPLSLPKPAQKEKRPPSSSTSATFSSFWNWKPLRALSHIRRRRFDCMFTLHVHSVEGLPPSFHGDGLCVHWKRDEADIGLRTRPARISLGVAEFEETLEHRSAVYGSRGGRPRRAAKYEARQFVVYPSVVGAPSVDLGKYVVDFARLLPPTLEELEEEASVSWSTTFKLSGKASGAELRVCLGFSLLGKDMAVPGGSCRTAPELLLAEADGTAVGAATTTLRGLQRMGSIPASSHGSKGRWGLGSRSMEDIEVVHEVLLPTSGSKPVGIFDVGKPPIDRGCHQCDADDHGDGSKTAFKDLQQQAMTDLGFDDDAEFTVVDQGIEIVGKERIDVRDDSGDFVEPRKVGNGGDKHDPEDNPIEVAAETVAEEVESGLQGLSILGSSPGLESVKADARGSGPLGYRELKPDCKKVEANRSSSCLDDITESVASEFLSMLDREHSRVGSSSDSDPESPRERLWKQFKRESLTNEGGIFGVDTADREGEPDSKHHRAGIDLCSVVIAAEATHQNAFDSTKTEALMREWGLKEEDFGDSPPGSPRGFGSPIELPHW